MRERITSRKRLSLSPKWLYTVSLDTPASAAMASMLVPAKALRINNALAAARIAARFSCLLDDRVPAVGIARWKSCGTFTNQNLRFIIRDGSIIFQDDANRA